MSTAEGERDMSEQAAQAECSRLLYEAANGDRIFVVFDCFENGVEGIRLNCGGYVINKPLRDWHSLAAASIRPPLPTDGNSEASEQSHIASLYQAADLGLELGSQAMTTRDEIAEALRREVRDAVYVLHQIVNAKEPPNDPAPDDADWHAIALEMKRIAALGLSGRRTTLTECPYDCEDGCLLETAEFGPCLCANPVTAPPAPRVSEEMVEAAAQKICCPKGCQGSPSTSVCISYQVKHVARAALEAALSAAPADGWRPTHRDQMGHPYRKNGECTVRDGFRWNSGIIFDDSEGSIFVTTALEWQKCFTPLPSPPTAGDAQ